MFLALWSVKGGSGVTATAIGLAVRHAAEGEQVLLVDLCGDLPAALGLAEPAVGISEWIAADAETSALRRLEVATSVPAVRLLPLGSAEETADVHRRALFASALAEERRTVVVDVGNLHAHPARGGLREAVIADADRSLLVTRACYLSMRRVVRHDHAPDGVVVVREHGRALDAGDIERLIGAPVVAQIDIDPAVARLVDAGLLVNRAPRTFTKPLGRVA